MENKVGARKGFIPWNKGKKLKPFTNEHRKKLSLSHIGKNTWSKGRKGVFALEKNPNWRGGIYTDRKGYRYIKSPNHPFKDKRGYVPEHRLVMEKKLGRYIVKSEDIHHINGIKNDNREDNLIVIIHGVHIRDHQRKMWTPEKRLERSKQMIEIRKNKFWSSKNKYGKR